MSSDSLITQGGWQLLDNRGFLTGRRVTRRPLAGTAPARKEFRS